MPMDKTRWGNAIAAAVQGLGVEAGTAVTLAKLQEFWQAVANEDVTELQSYADVSPTTHVSLPLQVPLGVAVQVAFPAGSGATTAPGLATGTGSLL